MDEVRLWRKNSLGIGTWRVAQLPFETTTRGSVLIAHSTVEGGSEVKHVDPIVTNGSGRSLQEQIDLEMTARVRRQLDKGYKRTRAEAIEGATNQMGLVNPMLALPLTKVKLTGSDFVNAFVQRKFDGHRCMITKQGGDMLAYTRKGKPITTIPRILEDCEQWMMDGDTLDGELYVHGRALQGISSLIKREQEDSKLLCFNWYDMVQNQYFNHRYAMMKDLYESVKHSNIQLVETTPVSKMSEVYELFGKHRAEGFEGSMLRLSIGKYEDGQRVKQLIKVKEREDGEVRVIDCRPSSQGWAILKVEFYVPNTLSNLVTFDISAPGSHAEKTEVLKNFEKYRNRLLTIEYAMLTEEDVPFHAVATRWHEAL